MRMLGARQGWAVTALALVGAAAVAAGAQAAKPYEHMSWHEEADFLTQRCGVDVRIQVTEGGSFLGRAPGKDGIVRRIVVKARDAGARPDWIVFALTNDTDEQIDRILVAPHFRLVDSGVIWPDLGGSRIAAITASQGIRPERDGNRRRHRAGGGWVAAQWRAIAARGAIHTPGRRVTWSSSRCSPAARAGWPISRLCRPIESILGLPATPSR